MKTVFLKMTRSEGVNLLLEIDPSGEKCAGICGEREGVICIYADTDTDIDQHAPADKVCSESDFFAAQSKLHFSVSSKKNTQKNSVWGTSFVFSCDNTGKFIDGWIQVVDATDAQCKAAHTSACIARITE